MTDQQALQHSNCEPNLQQIVVVHFTTIVSVIVCVSDFRLVISLMH